MRRTNPAVLIESSVKSPGEVVTLFEPGGRIRKMGSLNERLDNPPLTRADSASAVGSGVTGCSGVVAMLPPETE